RRRGRTGRARLTGRRRGRTGRARLMRRRCARRDPASAEACALVAGQAPGTAAGLVALSGLTQLTGLAGLVGLPRPVEVTGLAGLTGSALLTRRGADDITLEDTTAGDLALIAAGGVVAQIRQAASLADRLRSLLVIGRGPRSPGIQRQRTAGVAVAFAVTVVR